MDISRTSFKLSPALAGELNRAISAGVGESKTGGASSPTALSLSPRLTTASRAASEDDLLRTEATVSNTAGRGGDSSTAVGGTPAVMTSLEALKAKLESGTFDAKETEFKADMTAEACLGVLKGLDTDKRAAALGVLTEAEIEPLNAAAA